MSTTTTLPFAGGELSSFDPQDNGCVESTGSNTFEGGGISRCSIGCAATISTFSLGFLTPTWAAASDFWFHGYFYIPGGQTKAGVFTFYDGATAVAQIDTNGSTQTLKTLQGAVMTTVGTFSIFIGPLGGAAAIDVHIQAGGSGVAAAYVQGTQIFEVTGLNHSGFSGVTQVGGTGAPNGGANVVCWSQIICDDGVPHVGDKLVTIAVDTVSSTNADWSGPVTNINEIVLNDANNVTSSAAGQISTYYKSGFSLGTYNVLGVFIGVRAQLTAGSSTNLQVALRTNGANYFSSTIALDFGYQACCASWTTNPATGSAWVASQAAAIEGGMKSIA